MVSVFFFYEIEYFFDFLNREMLFLDEVAEHGFDAPGEEAFLHFLHRHASVFCSGNFGYIHVGLALALVLEVIHIAFFVQHFQVGGDGGVGGFGFFVALEYVPCSGGMVDVPKDGHDLKLYLGECVVFSFHVDGNAIRFCCKVKGWGRISQHFNIGKFQNRSAFNIYS